MKHAAVLAAFVVASFTVLIGAGPDPKMLPLLQKVFPGATSFSARDGNPPVFKAFVNEQLAGYVYWTTDIETLERGYDGPIKMLVGLDLKGVITGVNVVEHHEPYGNFSVEPPAFGNQFRGKSIRDPFKPGQDVDAVTRATITITSATRAIKNSSRRVARTYITPPGEGGK